MQQYLESLTEFEQNLLAALTLLVGSIFTVLVLIWLSNATYSTEPSSPGIDREGKTEYVDPRDDVPFQCGAYFCN